MYVLGKVLLSNASSCHFPALEASLRDSRIAPSVSRSTKILWYITTRSLFRTSLSEKQFGRKAPRAWKIKSAKCWRLSLSTAPGNFPSPIGTTGGEEEEFVVVFGRGKSDLTD